MDALAHVQRHPARGRGGARVHHDDAVVRGLQDVSEGVAPEHLCVLCVFIADSKDDCARPGASAARALCGDLHGCGRRARADVEGRTKVLPAVSQRLVVGTQLQRFGAHTASAPRANCSICDMAAPAAQYKYVRPFTTLGIGDVPIVGGKNASLGEMIRELGARGVKVRRCARACRRELRAQTSALLHRRSLLGCHSQVPDGFATTAQAFRDFLAETGLEQRITDALEGLDVADTRALRRTGERIRGWILDATLPATLCDEVLAAYRALCAADAAAAHAAGNHVDERTHVVTVAVRSSATAEDLPDASFAGQQETYLGIEGVF